jgi:hypothetical protein
MRYSMPLPFILLLMLTGHSELLEVYQYKYNLYIGIHGTNGKLTRKKNKK